MANKLCEPCIGSVLSQFFFGSLDMVSFIEIWNKAVSPLPHENIETHAFCISCYFEAHFSALRVREATKLLDATMNISRIYRILACCMLLVYGGVSFVYFLRFLFLFATILHTWECAKNNTNGSNVFELHAFRC